MLLEIGLALILAKLLGHLFEKIRQPIVIGEILSGIVIGPFIIGKFFDIDFLTPEIEGIAQIGIIFLLFISGLEIGTKEIKTAGKQGLIIAIFGAILSFVFGYLVGYAMGYDTNVNIAIGNIFVATSVGITVRALMELDALHSNIGQLILTSAILDDLFGMIILSMTLGKGSPPMLIIKILIFFIAFFLLYYTIKKLKGSKLYIPRLVLTLGIAFAFIFSAFAQNLGLATIIGAFFAGLLFSNLSQRRRMLNAVRPMGELFFIPLFFVSVGASFDFNALGDIGFFVIFFISMALLAKAIGCSLGAKISKVNIRDSLTIGVGMMPRMEVALVVVSTEIAREIFKKPLADQVMAGTILLVIVSSLITPLLLKRLYKPQENKTKSVNNTLTS